MPICNKCGRMAATAEMRRSTKEGWLCKDKVPCKVKAKQREGLKELTRISQELPGGYR